jgi:hypothetical protein
MYSSPMFGPPYGTRNPYDLSQAGSSAHGSAYQSQPHQTSRAPPSPPSFGSSEPNRHLHQSGPPLGLRSYPSWESESSDRAQRARLVELPILIGAGTAPRPPDVGSHSMQRWQGERTESYMLDETRASVSERPRTPLKVGSPASSRHPSPSSNSSSTGANRDRSEQISLPSFREFVLASTDELSPAQSETYPPYASSAYPSYGPSSYSSSSSSSSLKRKHVSRDEWPSSIAMSRTSPTEGQSPSARGLLLPPPPSLVFGSPSSTTSADPPSTRPLSASYLPPRPVSYSHPSLAPMALMARAQSHGGAFQTLAAPSLVSSHSYSTMHTTTGPSSPADETHSDSRAIRARGHSVGDKREERGPLGLDAMLNDGSRQT